MVSKVIFLFLCCAVAAVVVSVPLGKSRYRATHVPPERFSLKKLFVWPNTFYDVPRHRYPYYDKRGNGKLLYGYGGQTLHEYSVFRPLEGYFRRRRR